MSIYGKKAAPSKNRRVKKDTMLIRIYNEPAIGEKIDGFEIIKIVNQYGKRYAMVKRNK